MTSIPEQEITTDFAELWSAAGRHLSKQMQGSSNNWLKADLKPPFLEHLSVRLGNQLFYIRVQDQSGRVVGPSSIKGLLAIADGCNGHACLLEMVQKGSEWFPTSSGWGLTNATTRKPINPVDLITNELIEMTDWELQGFAIQNVKQFLEKAGKEITSYHGNPHVDPSIWFKGDSGLEWVIVRAVRHPLFRASLPNKLDEIKKGYSKLASKGHFASVAVASFEDTESDNSQLSPTPLWRGHGMTMIFDGLEEVATAEPQ